MKVNIFKNGTGGLTVITRNNYTETLKRPTKCYRYIISRVLASFWLGKYNLVLDIPYFVKPSKLVEKVRLELVENQKKIDKLREEILKNNNAFGVQKILEEK